MPPRAPWVIDYSNTIKATREDPVTTSEDLSLENINILLGSSFLAYIRIIITRVKMLYFLGRILASGTMRRSALVMHCHR
jgi:hypothetical protein